MLSILFSILMILVFGKILLFAIKAAWGVAKIITALIFLPVILIALVMSGLIFVALPILILIGILAFVILK